MKVAQSCPTLCDLKHYTVHGILWARILAWGAVPFSRKFVEAFEVPCGPGVGPLHGRISGLIRREPREPLLILTDT